MAETARADVALAARGLARSRTEGAALIRAGQVLLDGRPVRRPSDRVAADATLRLRDPGPRYVSRAAHKLVSALEAFPDVAVAGRRALDAGASTGGFTQVLLERGAERVAAVDVGHDQLAPTVRADPRVLVREGLNVRDLTAESVRGTVGMVTQDGHLFHETLRANLTLARPEATDDEVWSALERARLGDLVRSLPDGLETVVGERGYRFSGGERQRVTIARLLLARPRVVVLDEATASLDSTSEAAVQEALAEALDGRTSLVIAHRLSTIRAADQILVIEDGRVVERGTHVELLATSGRYAELDRTQFDEPVRT